MFIALVCICGKQQHFWNVNFFSADIVWIFKGVQNPSSAPLLYLLCSIQSATAKCRTEQLTDAREAKHKQISLDLNSKGAWTGSGAPRQEVARTGRCCWSSPLEAVSKRSTGPPLSVERRSLTLAIRKAIILSTDEMLPAGDCSAFFFPSYFMISQFSGPLPPCALPFPPLYCVVPAFTAQPFSSLLSLYLEQTGKRLFYFLFFCRVCYLVFRIRPLSCLVPQLILI